MLNYHARTTSLRFIKIGIGLRFAFARSREKVIVKQIKNVNPFIRYGQKYGFWSWLDPGLILVL